MPPLEQALCPLLYEPFQFVRLCFSGAPSEASDSSANRVRSMRPGYVPGSSPGSRRARSLSFR